jgi:hypothetical protein
VDDFGAEELAEADGGDLGEGIPEPIQQMASNAIAQSGAYAIGDDLLAGEGYQGSLPVPLDFRAPDLEATRFETRLLSPGEAPLLRIATLARWQERLLRLLSLLLAATGTFLLLGGRLRGAPGGLALAAGLGLGLWLCWSHGVRGDEAWGGVALGLSLALVNRIRVAWQQRDVSPEPASGA